MSCRSRIAMVLVLFLIVRILDRALVPSRALRYLPAYTPTYLSGVTSSPPVARREASGLAARGAARGRADEPAPRVARGPARGGRLPCRWPGPSKDAGAARRETRGSPRRAGRARPD